MSVHPTHGAFLRGEDGLAIGGVTLPSGATAAFEMIDKIPPGDRGQVSGVGDQAAEIRQISGLAGSKWRPRQSSCSCAVANLRTVAATKWQPTSPAGRSALQARAAKLLRLARYL